MNRRFSEIEKILKKKSAPTEIPDPHYFSHGEK